MFKTCLAYHLAAYAVGPAKIKININRFKYK